MNRTSAKVLVVLALLGAIVLVWRNLQAPETSALHEASPESSNAPSKEAEPRSRRQPVQVARFDASTGPRASAPPGPIEELAAKAGAGDAVAACQLAAELSACRTNEVLSRHVSGAETHALTPRCNALLANHLDRHFDWLRQAAHAGEPEAMLRYAQGEGFGLWGDSFDYLRSPHFDTWRREAPAMLDALLEAGYPEAAFTRMMANDAMMGGPLAGLFPSEPVTDRAYSELFLLLQSDPTLTGLMRDRMRSRPGSADREAALALAMRWHQDYFKGNSYVFDQGESSNGFELMQSQGKACSVAPGEAEP